MTKMIRVCPHCKDMLKPTDRKLCTVCTEFFRKEKDKLYQRAYRKRPGNRERTNLSARKWYKKNAMIVSAKKKILYSKRKLELIKLYASRNIPSGVGVGQSVV